MKAPAFQFYADDFIGGTITMSHEERGLYVLALCIQWGQGSLAHDDIERLGNGMAQPSLSKVKAKFELGEDGRLRQHRMEKERLKQAAYRAERSESGKKGAKSKWANGSANGPANDSAIKEPMANAWPPSPSPSPSPVSVSDSNSFQPEDPTVAKARQAREEMEEDKAATRDNAKLLLEALNELTGKKFTPVDSHLSPIIARLNEPGIEPEECEKMLRRQVKLWKNDPKMSAHLVPSTLFRASNFQKYYDQRDEGVANGQSPLEAFYRQPVPGFTPLARPFDTQGGKRLMQ